jgi:hypothetical protein
MSLQKLFQVHIHYPPASFLHITLRSFHRVVRTASRSEAVAVL